jgi:outer membrane biosynthesis protein TonB
MVPRTQARKPRNSSKVNLIISLVFHGLIVVALIYFAAREGVLGKQLKKLAVSMVKEKPPEKPKTPDKPKEEPPKVDIPKLAVTPKISAPKDSAPPPAAAEAPPAAAPPATELPSFSFGGGRDVSTADAVTVYKGEIEASLKAKWNRPEDITDPTYVAEVDIQVDKDGQLSNPVWKKSSGNQRWDDSVRAALAATRSLALPPPKNFPPHVLVRFDVTEEAQPIMP